MSNDAEPLLGRNQTAPDGPEDSHHGDDYHDLLPHLPRRQFVTVLVYAFMFVVKLAVSTMIPAFSSILEDVLCREQFGHDMLVNDQRCKADDVQQRLSSIRGWQMSFDCIPAILLTIPFGILADKVGRRPVLLASAFGLFLQPVWIMVVLYFSLPVWTFYLGSLWYCIGSFPSTGFAMLYTILADVTPPAERADCFFGFVALLLVAEIISGPLGGFLLLWGNWTPLLLGTAGLGVGILVLVPLPETETGTGTRSEAGETQPPPPKNFWQQVAQSLRADARDTWHFIWGDRRLALLLISLVFLVAGAFAQELLLQYATKRYGLSWSRAAVLMTVRSCTDLFVFVVLPAVSHFCLRRLGWSPLRKDLRLARLSGLLGVLGGLLVALARTPAMLAVALVVFSLGGGLGVLLRSLLSALVEPHHQAILNSMVGLLEFAGLMVTSPVLFRALQAGLELGGGWVGLPFLCAAGLVAIGTGLVFCVQVPVEGEEEEV